MKSDDIKEFNIIKSRVGSDTLQKMMILHHKNYSTDDNYTLSLTISYCIELAYSILKSKQPVMDTDPPALTPPKTKKAQEIYKLYQLVMSLKASGLNTRQIVRYMNDKQYPTVDELYNKRMQNFHAVNKWRVADIDFLSNTDEFNDLIKLMNRRKPRPAKVP